MRLASTLDEYSPLLCSPLVPLIRSLRPDDEAQEMEVPATDDCYPDGAYYYVEAADDQE